MSKVVAGAVWAVVAGAALGCSAHAATQTGDSASPAWPARPVRLIVPFPPGGATDVNARAIAKEVERVLGQPLVIDNRAGANSIIGCELLAKAAPDGYTLMHISIAFAINPSAYKKLPYDTGRGFTAITNPTVGQGSLLGVNASLPAKSVVELIALAKRQQLSFGSPGVGNVLHLIAAAFNARAGISMLHVPYKGAAPALTALLAGEIQVMVVPPVVAGPYLKAGRLRALGYSGAKRLAALPDIPTIAEAGLPGFSIDTGWHGWFGPAQMPSTIVAQVHAAIVRALQVPALREFLLSGGYEPTADPPAKFQKDFQNDIKRWGELVRLAKIEPI